MILNPGKRVLIQGAFDILNAGHIRVFHLCKSHGDHLTVALNTDELIRRYKRRDPFMPFSDRAEILRAVRYVDAVVPAETMSPLALLHELDIQVYVLSNEWLGTKRREQTYMRRTGGRTIVVGHQGAMHSSDVRKAFDRTSVRPEETKTSKQATKRKT